MKSNSFLDYMLEHAAETSLSEQDIIDETCTNIYAVGTSKYYKMIYRVK